MARKKDKKQQRKDATISGNFTPSKQQQQPLSASNRDDNIHGIIDMFDPQQQHFEDEMDINNDEYWYNNPEHIEQVQQFLEQKSLPFEDDMQTSHVSDDVAMRDRIKMSRTLPPLNPDAIKLSKRMQIKISRKLKQRGINTENMGKNELIQYCASENMLPQQQQQQQQSSPEVYKEDENVDISLKVWDEQRKQFTHSPTPQEPCTEQKKLLKKQRKLKNKWRKHDASVSSQQPMEIADLRISNVSPHWLLYNDIDPVILDQLSQRLPLASRHFCKTPQGLYRMNDQLRDVLQKILVSNYWPRGWAEKLEEQLFAQRLFNSASVKYDRCKVLRYIANELPLSLAVCYRVLKELKHRMPDFKPKGIVDFGQGPGSASLAAMEVFGDTLKVIYGIEPSSAMREFGKEILNEYESRFKLAYIDSLDVQNAKQQPLIISAFTLSEIGGGVEQLYAYLDKLWLATRKVLILVEAGTPDGFNLINFARSYLLSKYPPSGDLHGLPGTYTIAPCPHDKQCPLGPKHVCRWIQRVDRHQVPTRCSFKAYSARTNHLLKKNRRRQNRTRLKDKRKIDEVQFPFSYVILGKGCSPRLISDESSIFSQHFPHYFMDEKQAEYAAYFWPRILTPPTYRHQNLYLHVCLPDRPSHVDLDVKEVSPKLLPGGIQEEGEGEEDGEQQQHVQNVHGDSALMAREGDEHTNKMMRMFADKMEAQAVVLPNSRVCNKFKLDRRNNTKPHINITDDEGIDESEYGYLEKWLIAKSDNNLGMYMDARRAKWGELWPWQSPLVARCASLRLHPYTKYSHEQLYRYGRPIFRDNFLNFKRKCRAFIHDEKCIPLIDNEEESL